MGWEKLPYANETVWKYLIPRRPDLAQDIRWVLALALIGFVLSVAFKVRAGWILAGFVLVAGPGLRVHAAGPALERAPAALLLPLPLPPGGRGRVRGGPDDRRAGRPRPGSTQHRLAVRDRGRLAPRRPGARGPAAAHAAASACTRADNSYSFLGLQERGQRPELRAVLGPLELHGLRGQGRLRRVPRPHPHDGGGRPRARLRAVLLGVREGAEPLRHPDGADAASALDRRVHRLDGRALLRGVGHHAVPLPQPGRALGGTQRRAARPALQRVRPRRGDRAPAAHGRALLPLHVGAGHHGRPRQPRPHRAGHVRTVGDLPGGRQRSRRAARQRTGRVRRRAGRPARLDLPHEGRGRPLRRPGHDLVHGSGALGRVPRLLRPQGVATGGHRRPGPGAASRACRRGQQHRGRHGHDRLRRGPAREPRARQGVVLPELAGQRRRRPLPGGAEPDGGRADERARRAALRPRAHRVGELPAHGVGSGAGGVPRHPTARADRRPRARSRDHVAVARGTSPTSASTSTPTSTPRERRLRRLAVVAVVPTLVDIGLFVLLRRGGRVDPRPRGRHSDRGRVGALVCRCTVR